MIEEKDITVDGTMKYEIPADENAGRVIPIDEKMEKVIHACKVIENEELVSGVYRMVVEAPEVAMKAKPGQFVNVYINGGGNLLPRPISICWIDTFLVNLVYRVVGDGTKALSRVEKNSQIRMSSPLGNGFDLSFCQDGKEGKTALVVGGGLGVPPLLELSYALSQKKVKVLGVVGFRDQPFLLKPLMKAGADVYLATENSEMGFQGTVMDLIRQENLRGDVCFACGPRPMLAAITEYCQAYGSDVQVSMEERMGCGYGACLGCSLPVSDPEKGRMRKRVCKDGPIFWGSQVIWNE